MKLRLFLKIRYEKIGPEIKIPFAKEIFHVLMQVRDMQLRNNFITICCIAHR